MQLKGKNVFITGGAMGVGRGIAEAVAKQGGKMVIVDVAQQAGETTAAELCKAYGSDVATFIKCDVTKEEELTAVFKAALEKLGSVDVMVNNAGIVDEKNWKVMRAINIDGVVVGTQLAVEHMRKDKGGKGGVIINTASFAGLVPRFPFPIYVGTKFAVVGFTRSWADNPYLKDMGLRFGLLCPTAVDTAFQKFKDEQLLYPAEFKEMLQTIGMLPVSTVVDAFLKLVADDDSNGRCCTVTTKDGVGYKTPTLSTDA